MICIGVNAVRQMDHKCMFFHRSDTRAGILQGTRLLTWINFNPIMDK